MTDQTSTLDHTTEGEPGTDARNWGAIAHLSAFVQFVGIPAFVGPLVVWLARKDGDPYAEEQAKEALNFNISMAIYFVMSIVAILLLVGIILVPIVAISWFVLVIVATIKAANGEDYRYPFTMRFVS
jgi:uncharacterized protein